MYLYTYIYIYMLVEHCKASVMPKLQNDTTAKNSKTGNGRNYRDNHPE